MEYQVLSQRNRRYRRTVLVDGVFITVEVVGKEGTVTADVELNDSIRERLARFYNIEFQETVVEESCELCDCGLEECERCEECDECPCNSCEECNECPCACVEEPEEEVVVEEVATEPVVVEPVVEEPAVSLTGLETAEIAETADGELSRDEVERLYGELGSWSAVASQLGVSDYRLRKFREELGL